MSTFYELFYLANNTDVAKAVNAGVFGSGWQHFTLFGEEEGRNFGMPKGYEDFNEVFYLAQNPDVAKAVNAGDFGTGWHHFKAFGFEEGRSYEAPEGYERFGFNEEYYLASNPDVALAVNEGIFGTGWQHYRVFGAEEDRSLDAPEGYGDFSEVFYLANNPDVAVAVNTGVFATGWQHFSLFGEGEGRSFDQPEASEEGVEHGGLIPGVTEPDGDTFMLTVGLDNLVGNDNDNTFLAPIVQNEAGTGGVTNTFETGDVLDGRGGNNILKADLMSSTTTISDGFAPAIAATTNNIQEVYFRAQAPAIDADVNLSTIDAENMYDVQQWWSDNSRADIQIEDVRSRPDEVAIGMRQTDPNVNYSVYFNPLWIEGIIEEVESSITITLLDLTNPGAELEFITVNSLSFSFNGVEYVLESDDIAAADTYDEFNAAIQAALAANEDLAGLEFEDLGDGVFVLRDPDGGQFETGDLSVDTPGNIDLRARQEIGEPVIIEEQVSTTVVLDAAGNGSQGGNLDVGAFSGEAGVEVFNVLVDRSSHLQNMQSSNFNTGEQYLEEVYVSHLPDGREGDFLLGSRTSIQGIPTTTDNRLNNDGLVNVRVFDASGFTGMLKVGATLDFGSYIRYLDGAVEPVEFSYILGDGGSNLSLNDNNALSGDPDFMLTLLGGEGNDRFNLTGLATKETTSIDGGDGENTLELTTSTGILADGSDAFQEFENIQTLVVAGGSSAHNVVRGNMPGLEDIIIATDAGASTALQQVNFDDTTVTVSGKNQTLGAGQSDADQFFGTIAILGASGEDAFIKIDNTARVEGTLTINALVIDDLGAIESQIRTLTLESAGSRDTENQINDIDAALVDNLIFTGTQALTATVTNMGLDSDDNPIAFSIDGSELEDTLDLTVNGTMVSASNAEDEEVAITGTDADDDVLTFYGAMGITELTTVQGFERVNFGVFNGGRAASGVADVINFNDVELYGIGNLNGSMEVNNLGDDENVLISGLREDVGANQVRLVGDDDLTGATINVAYDSAFGQTFLPGQFRWLTIEGYEDINLDFQVSTVGGQLVTTTFQNLLLGLDGDARNLNITGRVEADNPNLAPGIFLNNGLTLTAPLPTTLSSVDVTGFNNSITASNGLFAWTGSDTTFILGDQDFNFELANILFGPATFSFTAASFAASTGIDDALVALADIATSRLEFSWAWSENGTDDSDFATVDVSAITTVEDMLDALVTQDVLTKDGDVYTLTVAPADIEDRVTGLTAEVVLTDVRQDVLTALPARAEGSQTDTPAVLTIDLTAFTPDPADLVYMHLATDQGIVLISGELYGGQNTFLNLLKSFDGVADAVVDGNNLVITSATVGENASLQLVPIDFGDPVTFPDDRGFTYTVAGAEQGEIDVGALGLVEGLATDVEPAVLTVDINPADLVDRELTFSIESLNGGVETVADNWATEVDLLADLELLTGIDTAQNVAGQLVLTSTATGSDAFLELLELTELIVLGPEDVGGDSLDAVPSNIANYNSIFTFTDAGTEDSPSLWVIDNFITAEIGNANNYTQLNLAGLGIDGFADLEVLQGNDVSPLVWIGADAANTYIFNEDEYDDGAVTWAIELVGVNADDLGVAENFVF